MKAVIQRVSSASVTIGSERVAKIQKGLLILLGIENADGDQDSTWLSKTMKTES